MSKNKKSYIPFTTKDRKPMEYRIPSEGDTFDKVSRKKFFTYCKANEVDFTKQLFIDRESGLVVALPLSEIGKEIISFHSKQVRREAKRQERAISCYLKNTQRCPVTCISCPFTNQCVSERKAMCGLKCAKKCEACNIQNTSRTVQLDMLATTNEEGSVDYIGLTAADNVAGIIEDKQALETLKTALSAILEQWESELMVDLFTYEKTGRALTEKYGFKQERSIRYHKERILKKLRNCKELKDFFE